MQNVVQRRVSLYTVWVLYCSTVYCTSINCHRSIDLNGQIEAMTNYTNGGSSICVSVHISFLHELRENLHWLKLTMMWCSYIHLEVAITKELQGEER